jgi:hypothetical protein
MHYRHHCCASNGAGACTQVNAELAARLLATQGGGEDEDGAVAMGGDGSDEDGDGVRRESSRAAGGSANILRDQRFAALFSDTNFTVDESDPMYKTLHPNAPPVRLAPARDCDSVAVTSAAGHTPAAAAAAAARAAGLTPHGAFRAQVSQRASQALLREHYEAVDDDPEDEEEEEERPAPRRAPADAAPAQPRMFAARGEAEAAAYAAGQSLARARATPLGQRANAEGGGGSRKVVRHGAQEITWVPGAGRGGGGGRHDRNGGGDTGGRGGGGRGGRSGAGRGGAGRGGGGDEQKHKRRRMQFQK